MARQGWIYRAGTTLTLGLVLAGCNGFKAAYSEELYPGAEYLLW